MISKKWFFIK